MPQSVCFANAGGKCRRNASAMQPKQAMLHANDTVQWSRLWIEGGRMGHGD